MSWRIYDFGRSTTHRFRPRGLRDRSRSRQGRVECLEHRVVLAANPIISEFLASNSDVLVDGHGNSPDWVEIYNAGDEPLDLGGYHLTDDIDEPTKWRFPQGTNLGVGEYLTVFASGENAPDSAGNLHTNFRLSADGEYLGLAAPNATIVSEFGDAVTDYPKQFTDISYGVGQTIRVDPLVADSSPAHVLVPTSGDTNLAWTTPTFQVDASWQAGINGVGYDTVGGEPLPTGTAVLRLDFNDDDAGESGPENTEEGWHSFHLNENGATFDGLRVTLSGIGNIPLEDRDRTTPLADPPALTYDQLFDDFVFARSQTDGTGLEILIEGLTPDRDYDVTIWSHDTGSIGARVSDWSEQSGPTPVAIESNYQFDGRDAPGSDFDNTLTARLTASHEGSLRIHGVRNGGTSFGVFLNALQIVAPTATHLIQTDIQADIHGQQTSAYVRLPFSIPAEVSYDQAALEMQYDAGFVAYLNGQEIARRNVAGVPGSPPAFDATAQSERTLDATIQPESIDVSSFAHLITPGENVLAIHALNTAADDDDLLVRAMLRGSETKTTSSVYFESPTPGAPNSPDGRLGFVADTRFSVNRGFFNEPFEVEITSSTPGAAIVYTTDGSQPTLTNGTIVEPDNPAVPATATVPIATTSFLRAFAHKSRFLPSNVDTQTYIFLDDVLRQDPRANPNGLTYPDRWQANAEGDYEIDPEVVAQWDDNNPDNDDFGIREALTSIPTMSIVMDHDDLWDPSSGIYTRSDQRGERFRRAASVEYFDPRTGDEFQINAGVQIHGGASRDNVRLKKHSFRLLFRNDFGPSELNYPLFADTENREFNTLVLRAFFTDAFATRTITDRYNPIESQYLRDVWMKDSQLAMGSLSAHNTYVHLYINGLYWGLYNPSERPDEAFLAQYLGGEREDWDIIKDFNESFAGSRTAWNEMFSLVRDLSTSENPDAIYQQLQGNNPDGSPNPDHPVYLDMDNLIDFMSLHFYAVVEDWPHHNWYAARNRVTPGTGFQFFVWDQEIALDPRFRDRTDVADRNTPAELYNRLYTNSPAFRLHFADRIQKHLFNDGALTTEASQARWMKRANEIEKAIIAESARWGDAREGERHRLESGGPIVTIPVMTVDLWREERDRVRDLYIPQVRELLLERLRAIDLVTPVNAPQLSQHGGSVESGYELVIQSPQDPLLVETTVLPEFAPVTVFVPRDGSLDSPDGEATPEWTRPGFDDAQWISGVGAVGYDERGDYNHLFGVDLLDPSLPPDKAMDANGDGDADGTTFYARFRFDLAADFKVDEFQKLLLKAKYDDGFAAYLNGQLIAQKNAPDPLTWDGRSTQSTEAEPGNFEEFDVSQHLSLLVPGQTNVLAFHAFNRSASNNDFLISAELALGQFLEVDEGPVYFTTDGTDPRLHSGEVNDSATLYTQPILLTETTQLMARTLVEGSWSALTETTFVVNPADVDNLAVTEINYNPYPPTTGELALAPLANNDDFEFIELLNTSPRENISLLGLEFTNGVRLELPNVELSPGEHAVVVANPEMFQARYGNGIRIVGQWNGNLANDGERITIVGLDGTVIVDLGYDDEALWPQRADGAGGTLQLIDPQATPGDELSKYYRWRGSLEYGGSPGASGGSASPIVINEVLSRTQMPPAARDAIELFNPSAQTIDISEWYLSDSSRDLLKFQIPAGTAVGPGEYVVFDESHFNPTPDNPATNHFALDGSGGDDVWLVQATPQGTVARFIDDVHFGAAFIGESLGRVPNGAGRLVPMTEITLGSENASARVGPVIVSELNYHPAMANDAALLIDPDLSPSDLEYIEVYNPTTESVDLAGWRIRGGVSHEFLAETLASGEALLVVSFDVENLTRLNAFRAQYDLDNSIRIVGGYGGRLSNQGELIQLQRPDAVDPNNATIAYVLEDEIVYDDRSPWPSDANGTGKTLHRVHPNSLGNRPTAWASSEASPGAARFQSVEGDFNGDGTADVHDLDQLCRATGGVDVRFDLNGDDLVDSSDVALMVGDVLQTVMGDTNLDGLFNSSDLVAVFQAGEYEDGIASNSTWSAGDWNCDGEFSSSDIVSVFQAGTYTAARPQVTGASRLGASGVGAALADWPDDVVTPRAKVNDLAQTVAMGRGAAQAIELAQRELLFAKWSAEGDPARPVAEEFILNEADLELGDTSRSLVDRRS